VGPAVINNKKLSSRGATAICLPDLCVKKEACQITVFAVDNSVAQAVHLQERRPLVFLHCCVFVEAITALPVTTSRDGHLTLCHRSYPPTHHVCMPRIAWYRGDHPASHPRRHPPRRHHHRQQGKLNFSQSLHPYWYSRNACAEYHVLPQPCMAHVKHPRPFLLLSVNSSRSTQYPLTSRPTVAGCWC
jgi:hypothetical protein